MDDIAARIEAADANGVCDVELDEHVGYRWGEVSLDADGAQQVWRGCQCGEKHFQVPLPAAIEAGFTG